MIRILIISFMLFSSWMHFANSSTTNLEPKFTLEPTPQVLEGIAFFKHRYNLELFDKLVDNRGNGHNDLYGVRNFRTVLHGILYRGGANNYYHKTNKRDNRNPLPDDGLDNLCKEGFGTAVYIYSTRFHSAPPVVECASALNPNQVLNYKNYVYNAPESIFKTFEMVFETLVDYRHGPIFFHSWNGRPAAAYVASLALMQFCDYDNEKALDYWENTTDGQNSSGYNHIRDKIRKFTPYLEFMIPKNVKAKVCPGFEPVNPPDDEDDDTDNGDDDSGDDDTGDDDTGDDDTGDDDGDEEPENFVMEKVQFFKNLFNVNTVLDKIVDNRGNGFEPLYGTRNMRTVLYGIYYRGGANNYYHKYNKRSNTNPLPNDGLEHLCDHGFKKAVYLYSKNYHTAPKKTNCNTIFDESSELDYLNLIHSHSTTPKKIFQMVYETIQDYRHGPIYAHCWNGWHATGYMAALTLRQFCDYSGEQAVEYWKRGADGTGTSSSYNSLKRRIRDFTPLPEFTISDDIKEKICPEPGF